MYLLFFLCIRANGPVTDSVHSHVQLRMLSVRTKYAGKL